MNYPSKIRTITKQNEYKLKEKKSVFIGMVFPVSNTKNAEEIIKTVKKKYHDASHHCFAFKLSDGAEKCSDAGEPNGTAGMKILNAIEHFGLTDILLIVIRFFGGIKLGTGPLGKAYYKTAYKSLEETEKIAKELYQKVKIISDFEHLSVVHNLLSAFDSQIESTEYKIKVEMNCIVIAKYSDEIGRKLKDQSSGNIKYNLIDQYLYL
jgi:uncharacterized YigZ family protein